MCRAVLEEEEEEEEEGGSQPCHQHVVENRDRGLVMEVKHHLAWRVKVTLVSSISPFAPRQQLQDLAFTWTSPRSRKLTAARSKQACRQQHQCSASSQAHACSFLRVRHEISIRG